MPSPAHLSPTPQPGHTHPLPQGPEPWGGSSKDSPSSSSRGVLLGGGAGGERPEKVDTLLTRMAWRGGLGGPLLNTSVNVTPLQYLAWKIP